jgi:RNA polymerase sigma-70 factor (sigma-E family)
MRKTDMEGAFRSFVHDRSRALLSVAYALTGNQQAAEDLLQTALAKTAVRWSRAINNPEAYVRKVMYHEQVSRWRQRSVREVAFDTATSNVAGPGDLAAEASIRVTVRDALRGLPPRQRAVLVLRFLEDRSEAETAELLGISTGAVGSQVSRGLAKLRALLPRSVDAGSVPPRQEAIL